MSTCANIPLHYFPKIKVIMLIKTRKPQDEPSFYGYISLLPIVSKLFEKRLHGRLLSLITLRNMNSDSTANMLRRNRSEEFSVQCELPREEETLLGRTPGRESSVQQSMVGEAPT